MGTGRLMINRNKEYEGSISQIKRRQDMFCNRCRYKRLLQLKRIALLWRKKMGNNFEIKKMETDEEIKGKAYVHWKAWHGAYKESLYG